MLLSEIIEKLKEELEMSGDMEVEAIELPKVEDGELIDLYYA